MNIFNSGLLFIISLKYILREMQFRFIQNYKMKD